MALEWHRGSVLRFRFRLLCKETRTSEEPVGLEVTRVTVSGGGKRKIATKDRRGAVTERYDVRWRVQLRSGETRMFRQRFDRSVDAESLIRRLQAVGLPVSGWHLDDDGRPSDEPVSVSSPAEGLTAWSALQLYRSATWRGASANGRKAAALTLRTTARLLKPTASRLPLAAQAYLDLVAFRAAVEPASVDELAEKYAYREGVFSGVDLLAGRTFVERWSLPLVDLDRDHVRRLIAELGHGRAAATEGRRWTQTARRAALVADRGHHHRRPHDAPRRHPRHEHSDSRRRRARSSRARDVADGVGAVPRRQAAVRGARARDGQRRSSHR